MFTINLVVTTVQFVIQVKILFLVFNDQLAKLQHEHYHVDVT